MFGSKMIKFYGIGKSGSPTGPDRSLRTIMTGETGIFQNSLGCGITGNPTEACYCSRNRIMGSTARARRAGSQVAMSPRRSMVRTTPRSTRGSLGVAW